MTTTRKAPKNTNCFDCGTKLTRTNSTQDSAPDHRICDDCWDYSGHENMHSDEAHDEVGHDDACRVCTGDVPTKREAKQGHTNGIAKTNTSHAGHDHPATKAARAACRKARDAKA